MTSFRRAALWVAASICLSLSLSTLPLRTACRPGRHQRRRHRRAGLRALPGATVTIHNEATGVDTVLVTNNAGAYTRPPLVLGQYSVTVDMQGFKKAVTSGILLQGGEAIRNDVAHAGRRPHGNRAGQGDAAASTSPRPTSAHTVNEKYYRDLPIVTAADVRLAESVLQIQPGYLPMKPNGDPMFRGSQFNSRINGGQTMATENFFDGAAFGYAVGHQQSQESTPPVEAVQEVKVITTTYSAQYGHTSGGFIEYTGQVGHERVPRQRATSYFANDTFNATGLLREAVRAPDAASEQQQLRRHARRSGRDPEVYDGHNKTFFFVNYRLHATALRRAAGLRQHDTDRRVQGRRFQRAADGQSDRRRRAGAPDFRGPDLQSGDDAPGQRHPGPRSLSGQHHPGQRPDAEPGGVADRRPDGAPGSRRHLQQRGRQSGRRPDVGAQRAEHLARLDHSFTPNFKMSHELLLEPPAVGPQLRRGRRVHRTEFNRRNRAAEEHRLLRQRVLPAHLHACMPTSSSTGSSGTTC